MRARGATGVLFGGVLATVFNVDQVITFAQDPSLAAPVALLKGVWSALATGYVSYTRKPISCCLAAAWPRCSVRSG